MSNTTYKAGDRVVITGNTHASEYGEHFFDKGAKCEVLGPSSVGGFYRLRGPSSTSGKPIPQQVHYHDFRPAESSYSLQEYRDRLPTNSEGWEGGHTEQGI